MNLQLHLLGSEVVTRTFVLVVQRDTVDSVALIAFRVALAKEHVPKVTSALVAMDLVHVRLDELCSDVALVVCPETHVPRRPAAVRELGVHAIQREAAATASKMPRLWLHSLRQPNSYGSTSHHRATSMSRAY